MTRKVLALTGTDRVDFLQNLVTNDVSKPGITYAALLTPQGKFVADFFVINQDDQLLIDVAESHAGTLFQKLSMYRLRADVKIDEAELVVSTGLSNAPDGAMPDPRHPALGWRAYVPQNISEDVDWDGLRVEHVIPETGVELTPDSYILEMNFEALHGVDFKKGCFVGQEIVARMKHKTELKKGLRRVKVDGTAAPGDAILSGDKAAGTLHTVVGSNAIAYLRFDRATGDLRTENAKITLA